MTTFTYLFYDVFPSLGDAFGRLAGVAQMPYETFASMLTNGTVYYSYVNVFTGVALMDSFSIGNIGGSIISLITRTIVPYYLYSSPLWVVLIYCSFTIFIGIALLKFFLSVF